MKKTTIITILLALIATVCIFIMCKLVTGNTLVAIWTLAILYLTVSVNKFILRKINKK